MKYIANPQTSSAGGGFNDGMREAALTQEKIQDLPTLRLDHEEANTRLLLHANMHHLNTEGL